MNVNFKFFNISSIKIKKTKKYCDKTIIFNNHFKDFIRAKKGVKIFVEKICEIQNFTENKILEKLKSGKKHYALKESNEEVEPILIVLMGYGYSRDYIINHIFDGYNDENLKLDNPVIEKFINKAILFKMPLDIDQESSHKERLIAMIKNKQFFPLFIDINHSLYYSNPEKVVSKEKIESLFKEIFIKIFNK